MRNIIPNPRQMRRAGSRLDLPWRSPPNAGAEEAWHCQLRTRKERSEWSVRKPLVWRSLAVKRQTTHPDQGSHRAAAEVEVLLFAKRRAHIAHDVTLLYPLRPFRRLPVADLYGEPETLLSCTRIQRSEIDFHVLRTIRRSPLRTARRLRFFLRRPSCLTLYQIRGRCAAQCFRIICCSL